MTADHASQGGSSLPKERDRARIDWDKGGGLVPAIVQHAASGAVLMLGYMNREALRATLERGRVVFFSRSKQRLWEKGESSGHHLQLVDWRIDCDGDTLLVMAQPAGPVCHTGTAPASAMKASTAATRLASSRELEQLIAQRMRRATRGQLHGASVCAGHAAHRAEGRRGRLWRSRSPRSPSPTRPCSANAPICSITCWCCCSAPLDLTADEQLAAGMLRAASPPISETARAEIRSARAQHPAPARAGCSASSWRGRRRRCWRSAARRLAGVGGSSRS